MPLEINEVNRAPINSPAFTGTPTTPTAAVGTNTTQISSTAFVTTAVANAIAAVNPAVAVQAATAGVVLPNTPTYNNGIAGIGAFLTTVTLNTALVVDGYTPALLERILVKDQGSSFQNGVYYLSQLHGVGLAWILTRTLDYDQSTDMNNTGAIPVISGTLNTATQWVQSSQVVNVGTDAVTFTKFSINPTTVATNTGTLAQFAATTSTQLAGVLSDEIGSGNAVFATQAQLTNMNSSAALYLFNNYI